MARHAVGEVASARAAAAQALRPQGRIEDQTLEVVLSQHITACEGTHEHSNTNTNSNVREKHHEQNRNDLNIFCPGFPTPHAFINKFCD